MSFIISQEYLDRLQEPREIEGVYLANSLQQGFIYHALNQGDVDDAYLVQSIWQYNNQLEINKLREAWIYAQKKFGSLRLRLAWEEELVQVIDKYGSVDWRYIDLSNEENCAVQELKIKKIQEKDRLEPYRLEQGNLFRVYLIKQKEDLYTCIFSSHHAILDGWSNSVLLNYIHETYLKLQDKETVILSIDYSYEEAQEYLQEHKDAHKDYWNKYVSQIEERSDLSGLLSTNKDKHLRISEYKHITNPEEQTLIIKENLYHRLKELSQEEGVTLNAILQYVWHKVLNIYGNSNQTVVGTIVSGRNLPVDDIESSVGLYINTLPLIVDHRNQTTKSVIESIQDIQDHINEINNRSDISLAKLQKGGKRLFDSLFMYQNYPNPTSGEKQNKLKISFKGTVEKQDYPLSVVAYEEDNQLTFKLDYAGEIFSKNSIEHLLLIIKTLLEQVANNPNQAVKDLSYLNQKQYHQIIKTWNQTDKDYPSDKTIHELFEKQVEQTPDSIAVVCNGESLTYRDLNKRANQLGHYLRRLGVGSDTFVAIAVERSLEMIIGLLGILKAGGAYVPLDSNYPIKHLQFILEDTQVPIILTDKNTNDKIPATFAQVVSLDEEWDSIEKYSSDNLVPCTFPHHLAYVIYTSGTTGKPKGVMIEHLGVVNYIFNTNLYISISPKDKVDFSTNIGFDLTVTTTICALCLGAQVIVYDNKLQDLDAYKSYLIKNNVNIIKLVQSYFELLIDFISTTKINKVILGGEKLSPNLIHKLSNLYPSDKDDFDLIIYDEYGPTEATVGTCNSQIYPNNNLTIGKQYYNYKAYVFDTNLTPLPIGAIGELYIGGVGLARGYLNRPELTAERFIINPFQTEEEKKLTKNARLYKTGDLVRWLPDGNLEYIGRNDFQVKIRGYRIELGEIESILSSYEGIKQSVVLVKESTNIDGSFSGNRYLVGYYVAEAKLDEESILNYLQSMIPEYMVPSKLLHLEKLPLTINGKLDKNALPETELVSDNSYIAPRNELDRHICQIWAEVLGLFEDKIGICDDFFRLGGDSLLAIILVSKINNKFKSNVKVRDIFSIKTIERLSALVKNSIGDFVYKDYLINNLDETNLFKPFPLTNVQQAYYLGRFGNFELGNVSTHGYSEDKFTYLNTERLEKSFNQLISRHLALRTIFVNGNQQYLKEYPYYKIEVYELSDEQELIDIRNRLSHKIYSPEVYPLFEILISKFSGSYILHISFDALLIDGNSFKILFDEWTKLYNSPGMELPALSISYRDYMLQYEKIRKGELFRNAKKYWLNKLDDYNFDMNLPLIANVSEIKKPKFARITRIITTEVWNKLLYKVQQKSISPTALILEIYGRVLCYWSGQDKVCINLTLFNRLPLHSQINEIMGDFTVLELFNYVDNQTDNISQKLQNTHESLWNDIENNLFDGIDFQRLIRTEKSIQNNEIIAPVVLTSVLGNKGEGQNDNVFIDKSYQGLNYSITQTSQVFLDNKAYETNEGFVADWDYVEQLFNKEVIEAMQDSYCTLIEHLAEADWDIDRFPMIIIPNKDVNLIESCNHCKQELSADTLFSRYESIVTENSLQNNIAVIDATIGKEYSYKQLLQESNLLSRYILNNYEENNLLNKLKQQNQLQGKLIGILSEKGYNHILSTVSIIKSGHGYLPLHIDWPVGRLDEVLEQGNVTLLIISKAQYDQLHIKESLSGKYQLLVIEDILLKIHSSEQLKLQLAKINAPIIVPDDIAYVIFTSGSTGKPKGVTISHRGALNTMDAVNSRFKITEKDKVLALSELSFDLSVYDIFGILGVGGTIVFPEQDKIKNPKHWLELVNRYKITLWNTVPQLASLLIDEADNNDLCISDLRLFLLSGDWISINLPDRIKKHCYKSIVMSLGGATEGSIWSIWYEIAKIKEEWSNIPYGTAMPNQKMYVLNQNNEHCPIGVMGVVYIGGVGVALNYWNNEELTNTSFIEHPKLGKLYNTGDIGRWHKDGYIEFIGRKDNQVKLNGYRVELDEISAKLARLEGVEEALAMIQKEDGRDYVIGYLLPKGYQQTKDKKEESIDKESFKLEQHGIIQGLKVHYKLKLNLDEEQYRLRKSYRRFTEGEIEQSEVIKIASKVITDLQVKKTNTVKTEISKEILIDVLSTISGIKLKDRALPKYKYPSGGSSYSVRCFLNVPEQLDGINPGYYYYNPVEYALCIPNDHWKTITQSKNKTYYELHLVVNWPSIKLLYGDSSRKLAYIEAGHMLNLLLEKLDKNSVNYQLEVLEENLDNENTLAVKLILGEKSIGLPQSYLRINCLSKEGGKQNYIDIDNNKHLDLEKQSIFTKADELGLLLNTGKLLVTIEECESIEKLILSGLVFQRISEKLYAKNIGSCMLGFIPYTGALYSMVLGKIITDEKNKSDSNIKPVLIQEIINNELSKNLPEYMLPYGYIILDQLPLSLNGKLEVNKLPKLQIKEQISYVAPRNEIEHALCQIWAEVLELAEDRVGVRDDFFKLGGNSILAIRLVSKINSYYQSHLKISDIFIYKYIEIFLPRIVQTKDSYQPIMKLNNSYKKPNMFMIHPGTGGCEAYISLANALVNNFSCYGVDSYNLYHENKIDNLHELAKYYLSYIDELMIKTHQEEYHLLGWSLGGQVSLEIACILEQRGNSKVKVYLLDSILTDDFLVSLDLSIDVEKSKNEYRNDAILQGYDKLYIEKIISTMEVENKIEKQNISSYLTNTQVLLFKAMLEDPRDKPDNFRKELHEYLLTLEYNNINKTFEKHANVKLIKVDNAHHGNILNQEELLVKYIQSFGQEEQFQI